MSYIDDTYEDSEFGTFIKTIEPNRLYDKNIIGCDLYRRGNMCFIVKNGIMLKKSHVDDLYYLLGVMKKNPYGFDFNL